MFTIFSNMCSQYCQTNVHNIFKQTFTMFILVFPIFHKSIHNTSKKYSPYFNQIYPNTSTGVDSTPHICDKSIHNFWFSVVDCECGRLRWQREASACLERWPGGSTVMSIAMSIAIIMSIAMSIVARSWLSLWIWWWIICFNIASQRVKEYCELQEQKNKSNYALPEQTFFLIEYEMSVVRIWSRDTLYLCGAVIVIMWPAPDSTR